MSEKQPQISVLMPMYNAAPFLKEAVESILNQSWTDFEFLIIDDGSRDSSAEIIRSYRDERIRLVSNPGNLGLIETLNKGIGLSKGKYIARMDADDISHYQRLEKQLAFMENYPETGACGTFFSIMKQDGKLTKTPGYLTDDLNIRFRHLYQIQLCHGSAMIRTEVLRKYGLLFDRDYAHAEDYEFWVRLSHYCKLANIPEDLYTIRVHGENVSMKYHALQEANSRRIQKNQFREYFNWDLSDEELNLFLDIVYANFKNDKEEISWIEDFLMKLQKANESKKIFPTKFLNQYIASKWFHFCYNASIPGKWIRLKYFNSPLPKPDLLSRLKLILKKII